MCVPLVSPPGGGGATGHYCWGYDGEGWGELRETTAGLWGAQGGGGFGWGVSVVFSHRCSMSELSEFSIHTLFHSYVSPYQRPLRQF